MGSVSISRAALMVLSFSTVAAFAQSPELISIQGRLTDSGGNPIDSAHVITTFKLYKGATQIWEETQGIGVTDGLFDITLGETTALDTVAFNAPITLGITFVGEGVEMVPRIPLIPAPYALAMRGMYAILATEAGPDVAPNLFGGGSNNFIVDGVVGATISGGGGLDNNLSVPDSVMGKWGTVGGGYSNRADLFATVGGGRRNRATGSESVIGGGEDNQALSTGTTVGGGSVNTSSGLNSTVAGGWINTVTDDYSTIGGGKENTVSGVQSTIGGGWDNSVTGGNSTVAGGTSNSVTQSQATIGGGTTNTASGNASTVAGGATNTASGAQSSVGGGGSNVASGDYSTVGGGTTNKAPGNYATVPGGSQNIATGSHAVAMGFRARAKHDGTFVWNDRGGTLDSLLSTGDNQFIVRARGGVGINKAPSTSGLHLKQLGTTATYGIRVEYSSTTDNWDMWQGSDGHFNFTFNGSNKGYIDDATGNYMAVSDGSLKEDVEPLDNALTKALQLHPSTYRFKDAPETGPRTVGLIAQDVEPLFPELVLESDGLKTLNYGGIGVVAIKAIQDLYAIVQTQQAEIERLRALVESDN